MVHIYEHRVNYYETDKMGITHHSNYIRFMEEARVDFLAAIGCPYDRMESEGIGSPVMSVTCDYKHPTTYPDLIRIEVTIAEMTPLKIRFAYAMKVGDRLCCKASSLHCFLDANGRPVNYHERYAEFSDKLKGYLTE